MWTVFAIIVIGFFVYVKAITFIDNKRYQKEYGHIFEVHKSIGYPKLTETQQFDILDNNNTKPISSLTQFDFIPAGLLNHYLDVDPEMYFNHLKSQNLKEQMKFDLNDLSDGFFINEISNGFEYIFVERQSIVFRKRFSNYNRLLRYLVYDRLHIYAPKKYKWAWLKKYYA